MLYFSLKVFDARLLCDYCGHRPIDHPASTPEIVEEKRKERQEAGEGARRTRPKKEVIQTFDKDELKLKAAEKKAFVAKQNSESRSRKVGLCFVYFLVDLVQKSSLNAVHQ